MNPQVVIVGGGIAGLATAFELSRHHVGCVVLEQADRAGGVIFSEEIDGYTFDGGPDSLLVMKPDGIKLCQELGLGDRLVATIPPRLAYIQRGGRLHPLPASSVLGIPTRVGPFLGTRLFSWAGKLRMGAELAIPPRRDTGDESIGAFIARRFGKEAATYLAEPLLAGIHAGDVDRLSLHALFPRFAAAEQKYGSLLKAFRRQPRGAVSVDGAFRSLPGGLGEMVRALVAALPPGTVQLGRQVTRIERRPPALSGVEGFRVECADGSALETSAVILATPMYVTSAIVREIDPEIAALAAEIPYASTATISFAYPRERVRHPLDGSGFVVPRVENTGILAGSWMSSKWPHRAPEGRVLLRAFVGGARDPQALDRSDRELVDLALGALRPLLGMTGDPLLTRVYRWERANAQHEVGHVERIQKIDRALARHAGLFITGSGFRGVGIPDCVADGRATAERVAAWLAAAKGPAHA